MHVGYRIQDKARSGDVHVGLLCLWKCLGNRFSLRKSCVNQAWTVGIRPELESLSSQSPLAYDPACQVLEVSQALALGEEAALKSRNRFNRLGSAQGPNVQTGRASAVTPLTA